MQFYLLPIKSIYVLTTMQIYSVVIFKLNYVKNGKIIENTLCCL